MAYTTIDKPTDYFNTVLYTGNGYSTSNTQSITGVGFQPDWLWVKCRDAAQNNNLSDVIRGASFRLKSNANSAESELTDSMASHDSDGFSLGTGSDVNLNNGKFVAWNWKAGTSFTNDASSTSIGSIDSTGSVSTAAGFSIISWTGDGNDGATIAHGLGATPAIVITKRRDDTGDWLVGGSTINTARGGANSLLLLNTTAAMDSNSEVYQTFSSTTFQVGVNAYTNTNNATMISYCFAEKKGYSKFGSYVGNGNANGTFVYTGFKPAFVIFKRTSGTGNWQLLDNKRLGFNVENHTLYPNSTLVEQDETDADILSNGFKLRNTGTDGNGSGSTYIYMAFAENPFVTSTGVPGLAR